MTIKIETKGKGVIALCRDCKEIKSSKPGLVIMIADKLALKLKSPTMLIIMKVARKYRKIPTESEIRFILCWLSLSGYRMVSISEVCR